jgi:hypothetical protein
VAAVIQSRKVEIVEFYCGECGDPTGAMVACPRCSARENCAAGRHRIMFSHALVGDRIERECVNCKAEVRIVLVEAS